MKLLPLPMKRFIACAALLLMVPALAACSFEIVNSGGSAPEHSAGAGSEADGSENTGAGQADALDRAAFDAMVSQTVSCESGSVDVDTAGGVVKVDGECAELHIDAAGAVVLAGSTGAVTIDGTGNTVYIDTASTIRLAGTGNTVVWSEGTPDVSDTGVGNTAAPARG